MRKKLLVTLITLVVLVAGGILLLALPPFPKAFDKAIWTSHSDRYAMHSDLLRKYKLIGMTRQQLLELLGAPDGDKNAPDLAWDLGAAGGADDNTLIVKTKDDRAVAYRIDSF